MCARTESGKYAIMIENSNEVYTKKIIITIQEILSFLRVYIFCTYFSAIMDHKIRRKLVNLARIKGAKISYQALSDEFQLRLDMKTKHDRVLLGSMLEEISMHEYETGRPLLSALVTPKGKQGKQQDEFYKMCEKLGLGKWEELREDPDFANEQRMRCYDYWRDDRNYKSFQHLHELY